jgi:hypothetical protein
MVKVTKVNVKSTVRRYDMTILLTWVALAIAFMIVIEFASMWPGTTPGEFALMTVFP